MTETEKELRRIMDAYIELSSYNMQQAIDEFINKCNELMSNHINNKNNDNSNKT